MIEEEMLETVKVEFPVYANNIYKGTKVVEIVKSMADRILAKIDEKRGSAWIGAKYFVDPSEAVKEKQAKDELAAKELEELRQFKTQQEGLEKAKKEEEKKGENKNA